jgi:four helix bundle protein
MNIQRSTSDIQCSGVTQAIPTTRGFNLEERLLEYSVNIVRLVQRLPRTTTAIHIGHQLLRSATSALANHGEAQAAESKSDFIHKMAICLKELREARRWLLLIQRVPLLKPASQVDSFVTETEALIKIFYTSIRTAKGVKANVGRSKLNVES